MSALHPCATCSLCLCEMMAHIEPQTAWDDLPCGVQQEVLRLAANPCARRVCKAWRHAYDAGRVTSSPRLDRHQPSEVAVATAAIATVIHNSPSLTAITLPGTTDTLPDLLAAGATMGLCSRLQQLTGAVLSQAGSEQLRALQCCTSLTHLDISSSKAPSQGAGVGQWWGLVADALIGMRSLTQLHAESCAWGQQGAEALAPALQSMTQLRHLHIGANSLAGAGLEALAPATSVMPALQTLDVNANDLNGQEAAGALCRLLERTPGLTSLDVSGNSIGAEGAALLAGPLRRMTGLQALQVGATALGDAGVAALAPALASLPRLHMLGLSESGLSAEGMKAALQALQATSAKQHGGESPLRTLELSYNELGSAGGMALVLSLRSPASPLRLLHRLDLSYTQIDCGGWTLLPPAFAEMAPSLRALDVSGLAMEPMSCISETSLAEALHHLTGLTSLTCAVALTSAGMAAVGPPLAAMRHLQHLDLTANPLRSEGTAALARVLPSLAPSLRELHLGSCKLQPGSAAEVLAPALAQLRLMETLRLEHNDLGPRAALWLPQVLNAMPNLKALTLGACGLGAEGCMAVARCLDGRGSFRLHFGRNGITASSAEHRELRALEGVKAWHGAAWLLAY